MNPELGVARGMIFKVCLSLDGMSSRMKRVARDGEAYDLFGFAVWSRKFEERYLGYPSWQSFEASWRRWREAPPSPDEVQDEREIALEGLLTRSAPGGARRATSDGRRSGARSAQ